SVLCGHGIGRGARQAERRQQCRKPADQAGEYQETSAPHGAQSYQTLERVGALLTNPLDPSKCSSRSPPMPALPASATNGRNCTDREEVIMARAAGPDFLAEWRGPESNRRHHGFQPCALPTELPRPAARSLAAATRLLWSQRAWR